MPPIEKSRREEFMMRLYGDLQIARFNEIYYQTRAQQARGWASRMNMLSAVASSGAFVGIIKPLPTIGPVIPPLLTAIAAVAAACGPFLGLDAKASQFERAAFGHGLIKDRIKRLLHDLKMKDLNYEHEARDNEIEHIRSSLKRTRRSRVRRDSETGLGANASGVSIGFRLESGMSQAPKALPPATRQNPSQTEYKGGQIPPWPAPPPPPPPKK